MSSRPTARSDRLDCSGELGRVHAADIAGVSNAWIVVGGGMACVVRGR